MLAGIMEKCGVCPNLAQAVRMRQLSKDGKLDGTAMELILSETAKPPANIKLHRKKLDAYFPKDYSSEQIEKVIFELLQKWSAGHHI